MGLKLQFWEHYDGYDDVGVIGTVLKTWDMEVGFGKKCGCMTWKVENVTVYNKENMWGAGEMITGAVSTTVCYR